jgi:hypothetical protein
MMETLVIEQVNCKIINLILFKILIDEIIYIGNIKTIIII